MYTVSFRGISPRQQEMKIIWNKIFFRCLAFACFYHFLMRRKTSCLFSSVGVLLRCAKDVSCSWLLSRVLDIQTVILLFEEFLWRS